LSRQLVDFKCPPRLVLPSLLAISRNIGDWASIQDSIIGQARRVQLRAKEETIVSAYVTPTLRNLRLIEGEAGKMHLSSDGTQCLVEYRSKGLDGFKLRLGLQLILVDSESSLLIPHMLRNHCSRDSAVAIDQLRMYLRSQGVEGADGGTRLSYWMAFLRHVELVILLNARYYIVGSQYNAMKRGEPRVPDMRFLDVLKKEYRRLLAGTYGSPYVPIPDVREAVCNDLGISSFAFKRRLIDLTFLGTRANLPRIVLATPMRKKPYGLRIGRKYYYFLAIF